MTLSILGLDRSNGDLGVAAASKFPGVRMTIPYARAGVGAVATQSYVNTSFGPRGLALLENGASPAQAVEILTGEDPDRDHRQVGILDAQGRAATFTGQACFEWAGGLASECFAVQGNTLVGRQVVEAMARTLETTSGPLAERLIAALSAGEAAGGDRRGRQSAALLVVRAGGGYGGRDDRYVDISVYDHADPIADLRRCYGLHRLTYFRSRPEDLMPIDPVLCRELQQILRARGFYRGEISGTFDPATKRALQDFMGWENYDERIRDDDLIDREVLGDIRVKHAIWGAGGR
jgi:uncharacterized Ntn-hydrolase superfamily protein